MTKLYNIIIALSLITNINAATVEDMEITGTSSIRQRIVNAAPVAPIQDMEDEEDISPRCYNATKIFIIGSVFLLSGMIFYEIHKSFRVSQHPIEAK